MGPTPRLDVLVTHRVLRVARGGRLAPWLGPALRGLAGGRLKARACRHPVLDQVSRWRYCTGCPLRAGCAYGETVEGGGDGPDPTRPLVIAADYPCPEDGRVGTRAPVRAVFAGPAAAHAAAFWEALRVGGADPGLGLGEDRVLFDVLPGAEPDRVEVAELPADPAAVPGVVPRVRVELTGPLVLMTRAGGKDRYLVEEPTLAQLLRPWAALARLFGGAVPDAAVRAVGELAAGVRALGGEFRTVEFVKRSHRTGDRWEGRGVVGWGEYGPVPAGLLPWLRWAGRLHVGTHRVAGAGGFEVRAG